MSAPVRILMVEDNPSDAKLAAEELQRSGIALTYTRVQSEAELREALAAADWDVVLSDWGMPTFNALGALRVLGELSPDTPLVIVSGTIGEESAVEAMRAGASDYVPKDRLRHRLGAVVERELRERQVRVAHRHTREALLASETRMARLSESGVVGIVVLDLTAGVLVEANGAFLKMTGLDQGAVARGEVDWRVLGVLDGAPAPDGGPLRQLQEDGVLPLHERHWTRADGTPVDALVGVAMLQGDRAIACVADITDRHRAEEALRRTEEQLRRSQKMEAIGNLAGGIAHDFNNLLTVIMSQADLLAADPRTGYHVVQGLAHIQQAADRAADLTRRLLAFGRRQVMQPRRVRLDDVIAGLQSIFARLLGEDIELSVVRNPSAGLVFVDPAQVEHVVMNLVLNARDAMSLGGKLTLETANVDIEPEYADRHAEVEAGPYVMLAVTDTGVGMDRDTLSHIFEPFFTTKGPSQGTGLGLAMVFGTVRQSGGHIWVYSELGRGTAFKVFFPRVDAEPDALAPSLEAPVSSEREPGLAGWETILLVEDDPQVRAVLSEVLGGAGYTVLEAADGTGALELAASHPGEIHLLCTDVIMPRMSGRELADALLAVRPGFKTLFISGYPGSAMVKHGIVEPHETLLSKPLMPRQILARVRQVLMR